MRFLSQRLRQPSIGPISLIGYMDRIIEKRKWPPWGPLRRPTPTRGAFFNQTGGRWVYMLDPSAKFAVKRTIRLGRQNQVEYEVLDGLSPSEQVIISSYENFGDVDKLIPK